MLDAESLKETIHRLAQSNPRSKQYDEYFRCIKSLGSKCGLTDDEVNALFERSILYGLDLGEILREENTK